MARRKKKNQEDETLVDIVGATDQAAGFIEKNQNLIFGILTAFVLLVGGYFVWKYFIQAPKEKAAAEQMYKAQTQFERDSFALALQNPGGGFKGFLDIIDEYGGTKSGNLASYYAGLSYLQLGEYEAAIDYLKDYSAAGEISPATKNGLIGDAYSELGDFSQALSYYESAVSSSDNPQTAPYYLLKAGMLYEKQGEFNKALRSYERIKEDFTLSTIGSEIDKYIAKVSPKVK